MQVPPASKCRSICGIITPHKWAVIHADKRQCDHRYRVAVRNELARAAKTRRGTACQRPANKKNGRCRLNGGASTGAKTEEGLARISAAKLRHGKFTKDKLEKRREHAAKGRQIRKELRQMERELIADGLLEKHWRESFLS